MLLIKTHYVMVIFHLLIGPKLKEEGGRQDSAKAKSLSYAPVDYGTVKTIVHFQCFGTLLGPTNLKNGEKLIIFHGDKNAEK